MKTAIEIALKNGWDMFGHSNRPKEEYSRWRLEDTRLYVNFVDQNAWPQCEVYSLEQVIFNLDFAKALAGGSVVCRECGTETEFFREHPVTCTCGEQGQIIEAFDYFLINAALSPDRQKYLDEYVKTIPTTKGADE